MKKNLLILATAIFAIGLITMADTAFFSLAQATPIVTASLPFENEGIDLETGNIEFGFLGTFPEAVDFHFGYHALTTPHAILLQEFPAEVALMDEVSFSSVTFDDIATLSFTSFSIIEPFENDDTMVVLTALGNYFKVGNAMENDYFVTFDYQQLVPEQQLPPVPEPATILLVGTGIAVIAGARFRRNKK
ncbi:MAG: hypothetical protein A3G31_05620 [Candidatus Schekmanbacteria bacterium RIFCSPLOWO2_12_FULL_38_15]|uniref:Ice-binding protein C-terminal domain-containing protein n=1 Tax=Candidatus Schekmanbacteria bacterium RIFCSPLOWO2_12_FULL_38_15 TaxID=1817883 RepID=A0A1F7SLQ3_9BACT|nr:MAG: hypothetical protein A3G31_05620 [Candidatus Schekmanbacteria bacterium RIFCSPLOWO2_12_FULL_38_15]